MSTKTLICILICFFLQNILSVNTVTSIRREYRDLFYHDELDVNDLPGPSQTPEVNRQVYA